VSGAGPLAECVANISEGRDRAVIDAVCWAGGDRVLDVHTDAEHNRTVLTLGGPLADVEDAARAIATEAVARIDLSCHRGVHPRLGAVDVVPFVPLPGPAATQPPGLWESVVSARDAFARWAGDALGVPCFLYGPERSLPEVRRDAFGALLPDFGPPAPPPPGGPPAGGARPVLVAYNVWIAELPGRADPASVVDVARELAISLRGPGVRALGLEVAAGAQVSCNLTEPARVTPAAIYDAVAEGAARHGCTILRAELVGLAPSAVLDAVPRHRWAELDLAPEDTIESRLALRGA